MIYDIKKRLPIYTIEAHKHKGNSCFFINKNRVITFNDNEMICWHLTKITDWKIIFMLEIKVKPVTSVND